MSEVSNPPAVNSSTEERLHHPFSPSKLGYLEVSPYWTGEQSVNTEASEAGTAQHDAVEHEDIHDGLDDDQAGAVADCINFGKTRIALYPGCTVIKEDYLPIDDKVVKDAGGKEFKGTTGGYCDLSLISADQKTAEIIDYKFGKWSVEDADTNPQGIAYLLGLLNRFPLIETVNVFFLLPHRDEIYQHTFKRTEFDALRLRVTTIVARAQQAVLDGDTSKCTPTVSSCLFCGNKGKCEALAGFALKLGKKYAPLIIPAELTPSLMGVSEHATETIGVAQVLEAWAKAVRTQITLRTIESEDWLPDGYKLRERVDKTLKDWKKLLKFAKAAGISREDRRSAFSVKMTPLNKAISAKAERGQKKEAVQNWTNMLLTEGVLEKEQPIYFLERIKT